jgi:hypothetical protein
MDASSEALVFAALFNLERSRSFLLKYLNLDLLLFFLASLDGINPPPLTGLIHLPHSSALKYLVDLKQYKI